jgi:hypothetical protein
MANFGTWQIQVNSTTTTLPDPIDFTHDPVKQGAYHEMLNGKVRRDIVGSRNHFAIKWGGLTQTEADNLRTLFSSMVAAGAHCHFICHLGTFDVILANEDPHIYTSTGFISTGVVLEETA